MGRYWNPIFVHYASLVIGAVTILVLARGQWFFGDDWSILAPSRDTWLLVPHVGHLNLVPALVFPAIRNWLGLGSYLPFLIPALLAHIGIAHLSWRILVRVGVLPWLSTLLAVVIVVLGAGSENILWAFQFGFMGAVTMGLLVIVLVDRDRLTATLGVGTALIATLAPMFSSTAIPVLAAAALVGWIRHGVLRTILIFLPTAVVYLAWYLAIGRMSPTPTSGIHSLGQLGEAIVYAGAMYAGGLGRALPWIALGILPAVATARWFFKTFKSGIATRRTAAYALIIGSVVFVALTTWSRFTFGVSAAATPRYAYLTIVLLLPSFGILLTNVAVRSSRWRVASLITVGALAVLNLVFLGIAAQEEAVREQASEDVVYGSLRAIVKDPRDPALLIAPADPLWATDLVGFDLLALHNAGQFDLSR